MICFSFSRYLSGLFAFSLPFYLPVCNHSDPNPPKVFQSVTISFRVWKKIKWGRKKNNKKSKKNDIIFICHLAVETYYFHNTTNILLENVTWKITCRIKVDLNLKISSIHLSMFSARRIFFPWTDQDLIQRSKTWYCYRFFSNSGPRPKTAVVDL